VRNAQGSQVEKRGDGGGGGGCKDGGGWDASAAAGGVWNGSAAGRRILGKVEVSTSRGSGKHPKLRGLTQSSHMDTTVTRS